MIRNLNQSQFGEFGTILPAAEQEMPKSNRHSIVLQAGSTVVYQAIGDAWLKQEQGMAVLAVSASDEAYNEFYLDNTVCINSGMWFTLTALQDTATVQMAGISLPRVVEIRQSSTDFMLRERIKSLNICTLFYQEKEKDFLFSGEAHPLLEILYLDQGSLHSVADGQDLLLQPGELVVYGPNQWHMQYTDAGEAPRFITLSFQAEGCDLQALYNRAITMPSKAVALLQQMLWEQEQTDDYSQDYLLALFRQLLIILLRQSEEYSQVQTMPNIINSENKIISCAQQYILANVKEKLSVPVVAKGINISPSYLTALFQKHLRISPGEYIRRIKLQQSKQMIREGELNFTEIAQALQYSTVHHFSRQFKEKFGITPTEYARTVR